MKLAWKTYVLLEMNQAIVAMQLQLQVLYPQFVTSQRQMLQELMGAQDLENYQACDQEHCFDHPNLKSTTKPVLRLFKKYTLVVEIDSQTKNINYDYRKRKIIIFQEFL